MRVLLINSMFVNALYRRAADALGARPGIELTVLAPDYWRMNGSTMPFDPVKVGSPYAFVQGKCCWRGYENRGFYRSGLLKAFRYSKPDIVFLMEEPFSIFALEVQAVRLLLGITAPIVFFTWNNLSLTDFDYRPSFFYRSIARWTLPKFSYALTANSAGIAVLRDAGFAQPIKNVGYAVDTVHYSEPRTNRASMVRRELGFAPHDVVIGYVGRMKRMKGLDLLIEAFSIADAKNPDKSLKLLLIGSGEDEGWVRNLIDRYRIGDATRMLPAVAHSDIPDYMHALDIFVLPSRRVGMWAEQFGRVLVEAMSAKKLVIGSSSGAIPEVIGNAGLVFNEESAQDLEQTLERAICMAPMEREEYITRGFERASKYYSWNRFAADAHDALIYSASTHA